MHLELAGPLTAKETVTRNEVHFEKLSLQQTGFQFECGAAVCSGALNKTSQLWHIGRKHHCEDRTRTRR